MARIELVDPTRTAGPTRVILDEVARHAGRVPNGVRVLAASPTVLAAWWQLEQALARQLGAPRRPGAARGAHRSHQRVHLLPRPAHRDRDRGGRRPGRRRGRPRAAAPPTRGATPRCGSRWAALRTRGPVPEATIDDARAAGLDDAELVEVLAVLALHTLHNLCNRVADTPTDPPRPDRTLDR